MREEESVRDTNRCCVKVRSKDVAVQGPAILINRRLAPTARVVAKGRALAMSQSSEKYEPFKKKGEERWSRRSSQCSALLPAEWGCSGRRFSGGDRMEAGRSVACEAAMAEALEEHPVADRPDDGRGQEATLGATADEEDDITMKAASAIARLRLRKFLLLHLPVPWACPAQP